MMMKFKKIMCVAGLTCASMMVATNANAVLVSAAGGLSSAGAAPSIIAAPPDANDDAAFNLGIQAFNEIIGYILAAPLNVDGPTDIAAGIRVDSHMIFLNSGPGDSSTLIEHGAGGNQNAVSFTFNGAILGVMSDSTGLAETQSSGFLGAPGTSYPGAPFSARGLEGNPFDNTANDWYSTAGNTITLGMRVTEPGDWIRVVTVSAVPIPAALPLLGGALAFGGFMGWRRKRNQASA